MDKYLIMGKNSKLVFWGLILTILALVLYFSAPTQDAMATWLKQVVLCGGIGLFTMGCTNKMIARSKKNGPIAAVFTACMMVIAVAAILLL